MGESPSLWRGRTVVKRRRPHPEASCAIDVADHQIMPATICCGWSWFCSHTHVTFSHWVIKTVRTVLRQDRQE